MENSENTKQVPKWEIKTLKLQLFVDSEYCDSGEILSVIWSTQNGSSTFNQIVYDLDSSCVIRGEINIENSLEPKKLNDAARYKIGRLIDGFMMSNNFENEYNNIDNDNDNDDADGDYDID